MGDAVMETQEFASSALANRRARDHGTRAGHRIKCRWRAVALALVMLLAPWRWPAVPTAARAQLLPFVSNPAVPIDPRQAFVEGVRAVQRRDFPMAIGRLQLAAAKLPEVGDYALFYLGHALEGNGDRPGAADAYRRLAETYPQSVLTDAAGVADARLELALGDPVTASRIAQRVADRTDDGGSDQNARLIIAQAAYAQDHFATAYAAAQGLRETYPRGALDAPARALAYTILAAHPAVGQPSTFRYHHNEAALLVQEGQPGAALAQIDQALALASSPDLDWLRAQALSGDDTEVRIALLRYLAMAPAGEHAAAASKMLARLAWRARDTAGARHYFGLVVSRFPADAAEALFEIGRTYEDDGDRAAARAEFQRLAHRYPGSEYGAAARFRAPFMLYMEGHYGGAAAELASGRQVTAAPADRDMFSYWEARALERDGQTVAARALYRALATSTASNYYPTLAARRVATAPPVELPAARVADPAAGPVPSVTGAAGFHLTRIAAFRAMGLREFEPAELRAIAHEPALHDFVLAEMQAAGAWYDAIQLTNAMLARGELDPVVAERVRYPRGFAELVNAAATQQQLDPWLVAALIRQESLYNPQARSGSDARGLMQLLPSTAAHWAPAAGLSPASLDLYDPGVSVRIGTTYLKGLFGMFDGDPFKAVAAYNGGEHAVAAWIAQYPGDDDQWVENIGFRETRDYVKKVIGGMREYQLLYGTRSTAAAAPPTVPSPG